MLQRGGERDRKKYRLDYEHAAYRDNRSLKDDVFAVRLLQGSTVLHYRNRPSIVLAFFFKASDHRVSSLQCCLVVVGMDICTCRVAVKTGWPM